MDASRFRERATSQLDDETEALAYAIIGAAIEVHYHLGPGLPESVDKKAMSHELTLRHIPHVCEAPVPILYKGVPVGDGRVDVLVMNRIVVELKAVERLTDLFRDQCVTYLQALGLQLALLINFNVSLLKDGVRRVINTSKSNPRT